MKLKVTIPAKEVEIDRCYHTCPHFALDGGPSPTMYCSHPYWDDKGAYAGCIISHPQCDNGFPDQCPLLKENGIARDIPKKEEVVEDKSDVVLTEEEMKLPINEQCNILVDRAFKKSFDKEFIKKLTELLNNK